MSEKEYSNFKRVLLITVMPFFIASTCNKNDTSPCMNAVYSFSITSEWSPQREVYSIGDTIFLNSSFSKILLDNISNQNIDYSNSVGISGNITTSLMDTVIHAIRDAPINSFTIIPLIGNTTPIANNPAKGANAFFSEASTKYEIKVAIILGQKGLFQLAVTNLASNGLIGKNCTNAGFGMTVTNTDKHFNLFQYAIGYYPDALLQKSIYCFRVQ